jgi:uncharacterized protein YoxC
MAKSERFDQLYVENASAETIKEITKCYMELRIHHGILLGQMTKFINKTEDLLKTDTVLTEDVQETFYSVSTLQSMVASVTTIIDNIDYQFKQVASTYPQMINKKDVKLALFVSNDADEMATILNAFNQVHPEFTIEIKKCSIGEKRDCGDMFGKNFSIHFKTLPMMFMVEGHRITELPIENVHTVADLEKLVL